MSDLLPAGIYFRPKDTPPNFFRMVTFNFNDGISGAQARNAIESLWNVLEQLKKGVVRDLAATKADDPDVQVVAHNLEATLCLGIRLFNEDIHQPPLVTVKPNFRPILRPSGPFEKLKWAETGQAWAAQTDFAIALHADSELGVSRALVEMQKAIDDGALPVHLVCFFAGMHRDDRRSWIDFHDGINNMRSGKERQTAIEIVDGEADWLIGGSTMLFLKIAIDLQGWRKLKRAEQEAMVGRDKLSGCPLIAVKRTPAGTLETTTAEGCPFPLPNDGPFVEVPDKAAGAISASHIHRANLMRGTPDQGQNNRIYRQGYEFVDSPPAGGVRVGLNFVSFQNSFARVIDILNFASWMGDANFGGGDTGGIVQPFELMRLLAGGYFVIPPVGAPFPAAGIFSGD